MKIKSWDITLRDVPSTISNSRLGAFDGNTVQATENDEFYTTDTEAFLIFNLLDEDFHLVYEQDKDGMPEKYTSKVVGFNVAGHLLDTKEPALVVIENWNNFVLTAEGTMERWKSLEAIRQENENQRVAAETARQEAYDDLIDTGVMQENINQKLAASEAEYAPRLTSLEQNDAELTAQLAQTTNLLKNQLSVLDFEYLVNDNDWSDALIAAHNALPIDGGVIVVPSPITIKKAVVFTKRTYLKGLGFSHSDAQDHTSTILKDGDFTGLTFLGRNSFVENIDVSGAPENGGDGINIIGSRIGMRNVSVRKQGGNGIRVGSPSIGNANGWNFTNLFTVANGLDGLYLHYGEEGNSTIPNLTSGILSGIDTRDNGRHGLHVGNTLNNTFLGVMTQHNKRHGVYVGANATGNYFFNPYTELNEAGRAEEFYLDEGSSQNYVLGQRSRISYNSITDNGSGNYILGTNVQIPESPYYLYSGLHTDKTVIGNRELSGRWSIENLLGRDLSFRLGGTSATGKVSFVGDEKTQSVEVQKLEFEASSKGITDMSVYVGSVHVGSIDAGTTKDIDITMDRVTRNSMIVITPRVEVPQGISWTSHVKEDGIATIRLANHTSSTIHVGSSFSLKATAFNTDI